MLQARVRVAQKEEARQAIQSVDRALDVARAIQWSRNKALGDAQKVWYKSWYPRVTEANGRKFLHEVDDVKDHLPDRTTDMSYLALSRATAALRRVGRTDSGGPQPVCPGASAARA